MPINASNQLIYESYSMYGPTENFMCYCNKKRANWYVNKNLATWIDDKRFKLNFEPNGQGKSNIPFYTELIENICVVCGSDNKLNKHHVVPYVFRSRFPIEYKESNHHDILATCTDCHEFYEEKANILKKKMCDKLNIKMNYGMTKEQINNKKIISARELIEKIDNKEITNIPQDRINYLRNLASEEILEENSIKGAIWADKIIEDVLLNDKLFDFMKEWRLHFVETMNPKFLPKYWSVNSPLEKAGKIID